MTCERKFPPVRGVFRATGFEVQCLIMHASENNELTGYLLSLHMIVCVASFGYILAGRGGAQTGFKSGSMISKGAIDSPCPRWKTSSINARAFQEATGAYRHPNISDLKSLERRTTGVLVIGLIVQIGLDSNI